MNPDKHGWGPREKSVFIRVHPWLKLLSEAFLLVVGVRLSLWTIPYPRIASFLKSIPNSRQPRYTCDRITWAVAGVSRYVPRATCLTQALVAETLLRRYGHPASLRIGVAKAGANALKAHAWVVSGDRVLIGNSDLDRYVPLGHS